MGEGERKKKIMEGLEINKTKDGEGSGKHSCEKNEEESEGKGWDGKEQPNGKKGKEKMRMKSRENKRGDRRGTESLS